jgi:hypothetical protein
LGRSLLALSIAPACLRFTVSDPSEALEVH